MNSKHTPGPWRVCVPCSSSDAYRHIAYGEEFSVVCSIEGRDAGTNATKNANARLIAAAPDMLATLKKAESWCTNYKRVHGLGEDGPLSSDLAEIRAAIANAEGRA